MLIIGISGGTGCGKTTIVNALLNEFSEEQIGIIYQDSYYKDTSDLSINERKNINFDHPESIDFELLITHLKTLKDNTTIQQPVYSFVNHNRTANTILTHPKKVMIIEGILIFSNVELRNLLDVKIFIHADADERLIRRLKRDITERGRTIDEVLNRYQRNLKPMHSQFIEPMKAYADITINNNTFNTAEIDTIKMLINNSL